VKSDKDGGSPEREKLVELLAYLNGRFLPASQAVLSLDDLGFTQGVIITERLRTFRQRLFRLDDHIARFRESCERAYVPQPQPDAVIASAAAELIDANAKRLGAGSELWLGIFATPGTNEPTLGLQAGPLELGRYFHLFENGAMLEPSFAAATNPSIDRRIKHRSRLGWWIARQELLARGQDRHVEPLLVTTQTPHFIRETPAANFIAEIKGALVSPPRSEILNGVSLAVVKELALSVEIAFVEREVTLQEVFAVGGECMLTNTSFCVAPVSRIGDCQKLMNGPKFKKLVKMWSDYVGVEIC
jgi:branched-chain amino acid aminotransferase